MSQSPQSDQSFDGLGIAPKFLDILTKLKFVTPTPIQHKAIPIAIEGQDIIGIAQTGTGKTLAFGIPMIQRLAQHKGRGLILLPTRELALQVDEVLRKIGQQLGLRTVVIIGGAPMHSQIKALRQNPHIIIATPGRLIDHLMQKIVDLSQINIVVLDEADRMLDMGFAPQIKQLLVALNKERQTMLFSATMPTEIVKIANEHMKLPLHVEIARAGTLSTQVDQELFMVRKEEKMQLLDTLIHQYQGVILIFSRTKHGAKKISSAINSMGQRAAEIHSNRSLGQRREAMDGFRSGKYRILVATDIAARGIDVSNIELVINFDMPEDPEDYVHRIGRTGRAGQTGKAITFVSPDQRGKVKSIERLTRTTLELSRTPVLAPARAAVVVDSGSHFRAPGSHRPARGGYAPARDGRRSQSSGPMRSRYRSSGAKRGGNQRPDHPSSGRPPRRSY
jgi:ATP-dependent RNA helicase RhlE